MSWVAGLDGCPAGWLAILGDTASRDVRYALLGNISEVAGLPENPQVVAVDIPIGLLTEARYGGRACDRIARQLLGQPRGSSVFSAPVRMALRHQERYREAVSENRRSSSENIGISRQCFGLFPKIREVDEWVDARKQNVIREVHPELSFYEMNASRPMPHGKKTKSGSTDRRTLLERHGFGPVIERAIRETKRSDTRLDDILDACAASWTAKRILARTARTIPERPETDSKGLRMEMLY